MTRCLAWCVAAQLCLLSSQADPLTQADVDLLVQKLGHKEFAVRQAASKKLTEAFESQDDVYRMLAKHADHDDPEVRVRVNQAVKDRGVVLKRLDPAIEGTVSSRQSRVAGFSLDFKNASTQTINIYWLDYTGKRQSRRESIAPGGSYHCRRTYESHAWLITDVDGKGQGIYVMGKANARVIFRGSPDK